MKNIENPIVEYLYTILERTDQLVEDVSDLRHRMAKLEQAILGKKTRVSASPPSTIKLNVVSEDPDNIKRLAKSLGVSEASALLRIHRTQTLFEKSHGKDISPLEMVAARLLGLID